MLRDLKLNSNWLGAPRAASCAAAKATTQQRRKRNKGADRSSWRQVLLMQQRRSSRSEATVAAAAPEMRQRRKEFRTAATAWFGVAQGVLWSRTVVCSWETPVAAETARRAEEHQPRWLHREGSCDISDQQGQRSRFFPKLLGFPTLKLILESIQDYFRN